MSSTAAPPGRAVRLALFLGAALAAGIAAGPVLAQDAQNQAGQPQNGQPQNGQPPALNQQPVPDAAALALPSFHEIIQRVTPAVVNVSVTQKAGSAGDDAPAASPGSPFGNEGTPFDEMLRRFFDQQVPRPPGGPAPPRRAGQRIALGSGFIIDPSGYVVTNNHVVGDADKVTIILQDNSKHPAKVVGTDEKTDLALVKIDADKPLPYVKFGDSDKAQVGDWIIAVGNPFGLGGTVTAGIISARGRDIHSGPYDDFLQLDASINRGNSGGPTFNLAGDVIGINTAIFSPNGGSVGIGFAIPSNLAQNVIAQLKDKGKVVRGWLGVQVQEVTPELARGLGLKGKDPHGALVSDVTPDSPAAKAGIQQGDVIEKFEGHDITKLRDLPLLVADTPVGKQVDVAVLRKGQEKTLPVTVAELPKQQVAKTTDENADQGQGEPTAMAEPLGLQLSNLTTAVRRQLHLPNRASGVVVRGVADGSPAAAIGLQPGDVIEAINQEKVTQAEDAVQKLQQGMKQKNVLLLINRGGQEQYVALPDTENEG